MYRFIGLYYEKTGENKMKKKAKCPDNFGIDWRVNSVEYYSRKVKAFFEKGYDVNTRNRYGQTLLMLLVNREIEELAQLVIAKGADVNAKDKKGVTPLMIAVSSGEKNIYQTLLSNGADIKEADKFGRSVLMWAVGNNADEEIIQDLLSKGADINRKDKNGFTPLMIAVRSGNERLVEMLIKNGADVTIKDKNNRTALDLACTLPLFQENLKEIIDTIMKVPQARLALKLQAREENKRSLLDRIFHRNRSNVRA